MLMGEKTLYLSKYRNLKYSIQKCYYLCLVLILLHLFPLKARDRGSFPCFLLQECVVLAFLSAVGTNT